MESPPGHADGGGPDFLFCRFTAPLANLTMGVLSLATQKEAARAQILHVAHSILGSKVGPLLEPVLNPPVVPASSFGTALFSGMILLVAASQVFGELQASLDHIWEVSPTTRRFRAFFRNRLVSLVMIGSCGAFFLLSILIATWTTWAGQFIASLGFPMAALDWSLSFMSAAALFAVLFRTVPSLPLKFSDVWPGAIVTAVLFLLGRFCLGVYVNHGPSAVAYGSLSSLLLVLVSIFYLAQVFYFGAEFTCAYCRRYGSLAPPLTVGATIPEQPPTST